jgi:iron complex outermembrane receptor protein
MRPSHLPTTASKSLVRGGGLLMRLSVAIAVSCLTLASLSAADPAAAAIKKETNIPAQGLGPALQTLATDREFQVLYRTEIVGDRRTTGAVGEFTLDEALTRLLSGTGLTFEYLDDKTITILPTSREATDGAIEAPRSHTKPTAASGDDAKGAQKTSFWDRFRLAQVDQGQAPNDRSVDSQSNDQKFSKIKLEEIIVTATKRQESVQDIPISIAVISNQDIERRGLIGMEDYLRSVPGVNQIDSGPASNAIVVRGITTGPEFENYSASATVASYFDETPITGAAGQFGGGGIDVRPVDIERIEVLRGPQGTAYGDASLGGALRMIPVKPKLDAFGAKLAASYSDTSGSGAENSMIQGIVNIPLVADKFALRAVGYRYDESGFYKNIAGVDPASIAKAESNGLTDYARDFVGVVQNDVGKIRSTGGRLAALWQATDKLDLSMNFLTQKIEQSGRPIANAGQYEQANLPVAPQARRRGEVGEFADTDMDLLSLVLNYNLGWATLTSVASRIDSGSVNSVDLSPLVTFPLSTTNTSDFKSFTGETRLASRLDGRFQFLGGLFYEDVEDKGVQTFDWPGAPAPSPFWSTNPQGLADFTRDVDQRAIFGEVSYDLTEKLTATVGGRFFKYKKKDSQLLEGGLFGAPIGGGTRANFDTDKSDSTFKANLSYKPAKDSLLYASWAEGFRLGRATAGLPSGLCDTNNDGLLDGTNVTIESTKTINPDFLENYEIGGKFTLFDRRMVVDTSVYHIQWDGLPVLTTATACNNSYTANAGSATSDGLEFQASVFVVDGLRLDFGGGYTKAELSEDALVQGWHKGDRLPGAPKVSANLAAQYDFDVAGHKAFVRADSFYAGKFYQDLLETPGKEAADYIKVDARAGVAIKNLSVELFVRNLTNEDAFTWRTSDAGPSNPFNGYRLRPRTVGIQLGYSFD